MSARDLLLMSLVAALICVAVAIALEEWLALVASICWAQAVYGWRYAISGKQP